jgi:hypothetical protein
LSLGIFQILDATKTKKPMPGRKTKKKPGDSNPKKTQKMEGKKSKNIPNTKKTQNNQYQLIIFQRPKTIK